MSKKNIEIQSLLYTICFTENAQLVKQMLEALETGHNQMISSLNPPKLIELKQNEVQSRSSIKNGKQFF